MSTVSQDEVREKFDCEEIRLYASHHQFYVQDSRAPGDTGDPSFWTQEAYDNKLALVDGVIGIGTGSYDFVRVIAVHHRDEPEGNVASWDHVTEAGLQVDSGLLLIEGCISVSGLFFRVKPGHYRVRCSHANLADAESAEELDEQADWYFVEFWSSEPRPPVVLKRWIDER